MNEIRAAKRAAAPVEVQVSGSRDSFTLHAGPRFAGASDVGLRHRVNQDALALAVAPMPSGNVGIVTVSDGVSSSEHSEFAAAVAADSACRHLANAASRLPPHSEAFAVAMIEAFIQAHNDVIVGAGPNPGGSWACTLICVAMFGPQVVVGNIGDSRCYWVPDGRAEALLLSDDDSVAASQIRMGIRREIAEASTSAHAITKWLGPGAQDVIPSVQLRTISSPGWLVVCSDGLWNYASQPHRLANTLRAAIPRHVTDGGDARQIASRLVEWARARGGHDNITVALLRTPRSYDAE